MTDFKTISLSEIHPDKNQPRKFFDGHSLKELTESVKLKGVLQPIMVRPNGKGYILVCGERRFKASTAAGLKEVPAVIRNLTDEEALEIQFIENIQREDVHPMDEATTFKSMLESKVKPYTITDIAAKINKPESFVVHRLALNNMIPSLQKEFWQGKFLIGQAVMIARLSAEDQRKIDKDGRQRGTQEVKSVSDLREWIERNIQHKLSSASFKKDDPTLNPKMGACTNCAFRSGNNPTLFDDVKDTDRCFKPSCFEIKCNNHLIRTIKNVIENKPEIHLVNYNSGYELLPEIEKLIKENGIKVLKGYNDYSTYGDKKDIKAKGIYLNGHKEGQVETIYLKNKNIQVDNGKPVSNIDMDIAGIKQRTTRAAELDDEKVWLRIHSEILGDDRVQKEMINGNSLSKVDTAAILLSMYEKAGSEASDILKIFGFKSSYLYGKEKFAFTKKLLEATPEQFNQVARIFIMVLDSSAGSHTANAGQGLLKQVAEQYKKQEIAVFEIEQKEKRDKREERAAARIKSLQAQKKVASEAKKVAKKPAKKKGKGIKALLK